MKEYLEYLQNMDSFKILLILIICDIVFGTLRGIKEKALNSTFGINGMIRKVGMIVSVLFMSEIQLIAGVNFIGFLPENMKEILGTQEIGIDGLFVLLFNLFEGLSIFKNMVLCGLPIPYKLQLFFEKLLNEYTTEMKK